MKTWLPRVVLAFVALLWLPATPADTVLKIATLAPEGTTWTVMLREWMTEVEQKTGGRLKFKLYAGGVSGDEPDVLRKIRFGQLDGGVFSGYGIGRIHSPARILEMPFLYRDLGEIEHVRAALVPEFERGFRAAGFEVAGWLEVGFVRFYSKAPIRSIPDLKERKIWLWQGDPLAEAFFRASGVAPVPLSILDVYTSLSTGLIDTVYGPPLATIAMQWFTRTQYMTGVPMANGIGALLLSRERFDALPEDVRKIVRGTGRAAGERVTAATRAENEAALETLRQHGIATSMEWKDVDMAELARIRAQAEAEVAGSGYVPRDLFGRVNGLLEAYRSTGAHTP